MKTKSKDLKKQPKSQAPAFLQRVKSLMDYHSLPYKTLDRYVPGVSRELRGGRSFGPRSEGKLGRAILGLHERPADSASPREAVNEFWVELGRELNDGQPFPATTDLDTFKRLFHARLFPPPPPPPPPDLEALAVYRRTVAAACSRLPLRGIDIGASDPTGEQKQLELDRVYVGLDTTAQVEVDKKEQGGGPAGALSSGRNEARPLTALEAAAQNRQVVLQGDPGSGKSTFLNHLALCLAQNGLEPEKEWLKHLPGWPPEEGCLLPVPVVLRDFAKSAAGSAPASACPLWDFIARRFDNPTLAAVAAPLRQALDDGRALVLLDGLDEIPTAQERQFVRDAALSFQQLHPRCRVIVTCRTLSYQDRGWQLPGFPAFTLAPFSEDKVQRFIQSWHDDLVRLKVLNAEAAGKLAAKLAAAIRRPDLRRLAPNPLLLTVMALVHTHKGELPEARAQLYEDAVEILLWRWEQLKAEGDAEAPSIRRLLREAKRSDVDLKRKLWRLAFDAHRAARASESEATADIGELELLRSLAEMLEPPDYGWAQKMIAALKLRAGLLLERKPQVFAFPHRTFQEYLAASHLAAQGNFAPATAALLGEAALWREVILLAVGKLVYLGGDTDKPLALAGELCPEHGVNTESAWRRAWVAGEVLQEITLERARETALGRDLLERVGHRLAALVEAGALAPVERAEAGLVLGKLGDPRPGVGLRAGLPDIEWVPVPAGRFKMGGREGWQGGREFTCHLLEQRPYKISRYPITVAQYQAFVDDKGYEREFFGDAPHEKNRIWTKAGWDWRQRNHILGPEDYGAIYQTPNHPRVGVSWYEAAAFCRWLTKRLQSSPGDGNQGPKPASAAAEGRSFPRLSAEEQIALPSEAEWERAAGGSRGRPYPWGAETDWAERCNMYQTGIGHTSAVGLFPAGDTPPEAGNPKGVADLAGNVWEWCRTPWLDGYKDYEKKVADDLEGECARVLRGGSWNYSDPVSLLTSCRDGVHPDRRVGIIGFRCVVVGVSAR